MLCAVLKHWHPMLGTDFHIPWPPGSPAPAPGPAPYRTAMILIGATGITAKFAATHNTMGWGFSMQQGTDIGPMIPHAGPPSITLPIEIILSSSKSHFGVARYPIEGTPIAVAALGNVNPNLNCGTPMPTPTGMVMALNTHYVDMTMADFAYGLTFMACDVILQTFLQWAGGKVGGMLSNLARPYVSYLAYRLGPQILSRESAKALLRAAGTKGNVINDAARALRADREAGALAAQRTGNTISEIVAGNIVGWFTGGPMGIDNSTVGGNVASQPLQDLEKDYLNSQAVPEHSGDPPAPAAPPPSDASAPPPPPADPAPSPPSGPADAGPSDSDAGGSCPAPEPEPAPPPAPEPSCGPEPEPNSCEADPPSGDAGAGAN